MKLKFTYPPGTLREDIQQAAPSRTINASRKPLGMADAAPRTVAQKARPAGAVTENDGSTEVDPAPDQESKAKRKFSLPRGELNR